MAIVDVILPIYKAKDVIYQSIESVINQSYQDWHLSIIDDASNDDRLDEIRNKYSYYADKISYYQFSINKRAAACRNYAIKNGTGKYIAFIDQDDIWLEDKLQFQVDYLEKAGIDAVHTNIEFINSSGLVIWPEQSERENEKRRLVDWNNQSQVALAKQLFMKPNIRIISSMIRRDLFEKIGGFKDMYFGGEDEVYWFEVAYHGKIGFLNRVLIQRREHESNTVTVYKSERFIGYLKALKYLKNNYYNDIQDIYHLKEKALFYSLINILRRENKHLLLLKYTLISLYNYPKTTFLKIIKK